MSKPLPTMPGFLWIPTLFGVGLAVLLVGWFATTSYGASRGVPRYTMAVRDGGTSTDRSYDIATDEDGHLYDVGVFSGSSTIGGQSVTSAGSLDGYVAKYATNGVPIWVRTFGGNDANINGDSPFSVRVAADGSVYAAGLFSGTCTFADGVQFTSLGGTDMFLTKYNADGVHQWTRVGGSVSNSDVGRSVAVDDAGNVYMVGEFGGGATGSVFDGQTLVPTGNVSHDWALLKYSSDGTLLSATNLGGGIGFDVPNQIVVDGTSLYVAGLMNGTSVTYGGIPLTGAGGNDIIILKADLSGTVAWAANFGGTGNDAAIAMTISGDALYVSGSVGSTFTYGTTSVTNGGSTDAFLARHSTVDGSNVWVATVAGGGADTARGVIVDADGIYQIGSFSGTATVAGTSFTSAGNTDMYLASFDPGTGAGQWALQSGGTDVDTPRKCAFSNGIVCDGYFASTATFGSFSLASAGDVDPFMFRVTEVPGSVKQYARPTPTLAFTVRREGETGLSYAVSSQNNVAASRVDIVDAGCAADPVLQEGDTDADGLLDQGETWTFACAAVNPTLVGAVTPVVYAEGNGYYVSLPATWTR